MIVGSGRGYMVGGLLGKYGGELRVLRGKNGLRFCCFGGSGKFGGGGEAGNDGGAHRNKTRTASNNSVESSVLAGSVDVRGFFLPLIVFEETGVSDGVHVYVTRGASGGFKE